LRKSHRPVAMLPGYRIRLNLEIGKEFKRFLIGLTVRYASLSMYINNVFSNPLVDSDVVICIKCWYEQGCQIFLGAKYQNGEKCTKLPRTIPNVHKIKQTRL
jgi:hypothetical protein